MRSFIAFLVAFSSLSLLFYINYVNSDESLSAHLITNCDGTQFIRTSPTEIRIQTVPENLPGCIWYISSGTSNLSQKNQNLGIISDVTNCSGLRVISYSDKSYRSFYVEENLPNCVKVAKMPDQTSESSVDLSHGPLLDLASTDIVNYRAKLLKDQWVRFANAIRSARIRRAANKKSQTEAIMMRNDAVVVSGEVTGWTKVTGAELEIVNEHENHVAPKTENKATWYTAWRLLRDPNASDLVKIEQADHAYWSDIAYTKVDRYVNIRSNPNYEAPIVTTLWNNYPLFIVSTVDNWSLVRNDSWTIKWYIRSDFLRVEKIQRVDTSRGVK